MENRHDEKINPNSFFFENTVSIFVAVGTGKIDDKTLKYIIALLHTQHTLFPFPAHSTTILKMCIDVYITLCC